MMNLVSVMLIYFYLPPEGAGLPVLIPQMVVLGFFTLFSLILASGRLIDAITDPLVAWLSDKSKTRIGRRIPFMLVSLIPTGLFTIILFFPVHNYQSMSNYLWLFFTQAGFYISLTLYIVPYNALMPELAQGKERKLKFSTLLSLMFVAGIIFASQIPQLASVLRKWFGVENMTHSYQYSIMVMAGISVILMSLPVFAVNEKRYCDMKPSTIGIFPSLKTTFSNRRFMIFLSADAAFFLTLAIISSAVLYYVKVLLNLPEEYASKVFALLIILSLFYYPFIRQLTLKFGKRKLILLSFLVFAFLFLFVFFMGKIPLLPEIQLLLLALFGSFPVAILGILPFSLVAEMAEEAANTSGEKTEGMYFAVRTFADKIGQTLGVMIFAILTVFGKDPGNDLGIRLSAVAGMLVSLLAYVFFLRFRE